MNLEERQGIIERLCLYIANLENENVEEPAPSQEEKTEIPNLIERRCDLCEWGTPLKADEENCFSNNCILCHFGACEGLCAVDFWCSHFEAKK